MQAVSASALAVLILKVHTADQFTVMPLTSAAWLTYAVPDGELFVVLADHASSLPFVCSAVAAAGTNWSAHQRESEPDFPFQITHAHSTPQAQQT